MVSIYTPFRATDPNGLLLTCHQYRLLRFIAARDRPLKLLHVGAGRVSALTTLRLARLIEVVSEMYCVTDVARRIYNQIPEDYWDVKLDFW